MSMLRRDRLVNTSAPLEDGFSLYLDLVRFLAAMCVFIGHATESGSLYFGYLPFGNFKHDAVIIFFVLSGLVICATATRPGETWITYLTARASRIYSVAIPAVVLSFGLQAIAAFLEPGHSQPEPSADVFLPLSALLFILQSWHPQALPWNGPYWSLCYEVWYYIIFGILLFVRNSGRRNAVAACAALIAGPAILLLFPIWLMGVWIVQGPRFSLGPKSINFIIFFGTFGAVAILDHLDIAIRTRFFLAAHIPGFWRLHYSERFLTDYAVGLLVTLNFMAFYAVQEHFSVALRSAAKIIRFFLPDIRFLCICFITR